MSNGVRSDRSNTKAVLNGSMSKVSDGRTWLRHSEYKQAGMIDLLILEGVYSQKEIAIKVEKAFPGVTDAEKRVQSHIDHLQNGEPRGRAAGTKPHCLKITTDVARKVGFDIT
ncbi:MAG: hypothetical protein ABFD06_07765 [Smithella sp.]|jgi:hypothetical protein